MDDRGAKARIRAAVLKEAHDIASAGWPVFPVAGKYPAIGKDDGGRGFLDATADTTAIDGLFKKSNGYTGLAVNLGAAGLLLFDIDPRNGGSETADELFAKHGRPETVESWTGGGGVHLFFRAPAGLHATSKTGAWKGIDIKANGYAILPPSSHPSGGEYRWKVSPEDVDNLPEPPDWIIERFRTAKKPAGKAYTRKPTDGQADPENPEIPEGTRDDAFTSYAGSMRRVGFDAEAIFAALLEVNGARCNPPLPEEDVRRIADSVARYEPGAPIKVEDVELTPRPDVPEDWPDPIPLDADAPPPPAPGILPSWAGDMAEAVAAYSQVPRELAIALTLGIAASCVQGKYRIETAHGHHEHLALWIAPALPPGERKTGALSLLSRPVRDWEAKAAARIEAPRKAAKIRRGVLEARIAKMQRSAAAEGDSREQEILIREAIEIDAKLPEVPVVPQVTTSDATPEALARLLIEQNERIGILSSEGGIFDTLGGRYAKDGRANLDLACKAYDGEPERIERVTREPIWLRQPLVTFALAPQPSVLESMIERGHFRGVGFVARFAFLLPVPRAGTRAVNGVPISAAVRNRYDAAVTRMIDMRGIMDEDARENPRTLELSADARELWAEYFDGMEAAMRPGGRFDALKDWASKQAGRVGRIAGILHCMRHAEKDAGTPQSAQVTPDTMIRAISLGETLEAHTRAVWEMVHAAGGIDLARRVAAWIARRPQKHAPFTKNELCAAFRSSMSGGDRDRAIAILVDHGIVSWDKVKTSGRGRTAVQICVNPKFNYML